MEQRTKITLLLCILAFFLNACSGSGRSFTSKDYGYDGPDDDTPAPLPVVDEPAPEPVAQPIPLEEPEPTIISIRPNTPESYTVKQGDTLWDIATSFLQDPWLWPEIWYFNPQIDNPHLIYPGDIISLVYVDGKPRLQLSRDGNVVNPPASDGTTVPKTSPGYTPSGLKTVKLSPKIRKESLGQSIPTVPINAIRPFLVDARVITKEQLDEAPYIVSSLDDHLISGPAHTIYVRGLEKDDDVRYNVFRPGRVFRNPNNKKEILGYETTLVSEAKLQKFDEVSTMLITKSRRETLSGDRILPAEKGAVSFNFVPSAPEIEINGEIIAFVDAISHVAQNQIIVVNMGQRDGLEVGNVLAIDQSGGRFRDRLAAAEKQLIDLPNKRAGLALVFKTFDRVSYAMIMDSTRSIHLGDVVRNPSPVADVLTQ